MRLTVIMASRLPMVCKCGAKFYGPDANHWYVAHLIKGELK